jgi:ABC-type transport system involved in cytochrome bd biosynthesis fused ATPase/permease subunit
MIMKKEASISKDILIIILIAIPFAFIDWRTALSIAAICASILLIRRTMLYPKPGHSKGYFTNLMML